MAKRSAPDSSDSSTTATTHDTAASTPAGASGASNTTDATGQTWILHPEPPWSPLFEVEETAKVYDETYGITTRLYTPVGVSTADITEANGMFPQFTDKKLEATAQCLQHYPHLSPNTKMSFVEFGQRRDLSKGLFRCAGGLVDVGGKVQFAAVLRADELLTVFNVFREDVTARAATPEGAANPEVMAAKKLLDDAAQEVIDKQAQGKADSKKTQEKESLLTGELATLKEENARLRAALGAQGTLVDGPTAAQPTPATGATGHATGKKAGGTHKLPSPAVPGKNARKSPR